MKEYIHKETIYIERHIYEGRNTQRDLNIEELFTHKQYILERINILGKPTWKG